MNKILAASLGLLLSVSAAAAPVESISVHLQGEIGERYDKTINNNLLKVDIDNDFLLPLKEKKSEGGYVAIGKFTAAACQFAHDTNNPAVIALKDKLIASLLQDQEKDGYIAFMRADKRMWTLWDVHETSYIILALLKNYRLFHHQPSLKGAKNAANYLLRNWKTSPPKEPTPWGINLQTGITGLELALLDLYKITGDDTTLAFVLDPLKLNSWAGPITKGRGDTLDGHAYSHLARCLAQLQLYGITRDPKLFHAPHRLITFLTQGNGLVITGECGMEECWHDTQQGTELLGETCASAYLIRFFHELLLVETKASYGDLMERTLFNGFFAAQSPDGRQLRYYTPFEGPRKYFKSDTYCCPNNFRYLMADLPSMVYHNSEKGLYVDLYTASESRVKFKGGASLFIKQKTNYPHDGQVVFELTPSQPVFLSLRLRVPRWCVLSSVYVDGKKIERPLIEDSFIVVQRKWNKKSTLQVNFPMTWRFIKGRQTQTGHVAIMKGPIVFTINPQLNHLSPTADLSSLVLDGSSLDRARAQIKGHLAGQEQNFQLTPFPDPNGQRVYFQFEKLPDALREDDELYKIEL